MTQQAIFAIIENFYDCHSTSSNVLTSDERYEIWNVKKEERPHWMNEQKCTNDTSNNQKQSEQPQQEKSQQIQNNVKEEKKSCIEEVNKDSVCSNNISSRNDIEKGEEIQLPLIDGCDIPTWRQQSLVQISQSLESVLNVGSGCPLLRRESQLPILSSKAFQPWLILKEKMLETANKNVYRMNYKDCESIHPWFEKENVPAIVDGCANDWEAMKSCLWNELVKRFGNYDWRFSDTHGAFMTLDTYTKYVHSLEGLSDNAPLGIYDSEFNTDERISICDQEYSVPSCFATDLFELVPDPRPPFRWMLMGPPRSGTGLHIDPMGTHAWLTLLQGRKRWILFPFGTNPKDIYMQSPQIPSALWFANHYDEVIKKFPTAAELVQHPGETVYVPAGWPHVVLNLDFTVAITHNYATEYPTMDRLISAMKREEPCYTKTWMDAVKDQRPDLVQNNPCLFD